MRCSASTLVLATLAAGQAAAVNVRHANFHSRRMAQPAENVEARDVSEADLKKVAWESIDWKNLINWSTINYGGGASATAAPVATTLQSVAATDAIKAAVLATPTAASKVSSASAAATSSSSSDDNPITELITDLLSSKIVKLGLKAVGLNPTSNTGSGCWIGDDGDFKQTFTNNHDDDVVLVVWGASGSWVNEKQPLVTVSLAKGESKTLSYVDGHTGGFSVIYDDTDLVNGQVSETWGEYTFGTNGAGVFDVSREVKMSGRNLSMVGKSCTSDMDTCVFKCTNGADTCGELGTYDLFSCEASNGGGAGTYDGAASGGCMMDVDEHIQVTIG